jgi:hypothetical protein
MSGTTNTAAQSRHRPDDKRAISCEHPDFTDHPARIDKRNGAESENRMNRHNPAAGCACRAIRDEALATHPVTECKTSVIR